MMISHNYVYSSCLKLITRCQSTHVLIKDPPVINSTDYLHKSGMRTLPIPLRKALTQVLSEVDKSSIRTNSLKIFDSLRSTTGSCPKKPSQQGPRSIPHPNKVLPPHHIVYDENTVNAYLASRMPGTYTGIHRALTETYLKLDTPPTSVLDLGTGPGTSVWALREIEPKFGISDCAQVTAVDVNTHMLDMARRLAHVMHLGDKVTWLDYLPVNATFDLSIAGYVLGEMEDEAGRERLLSSIWGMTKSTLVLIERGTPLGYSRINKAREWLISQDNTKILAPCPHMKTCPLSASGKDWCHFSQRLERPTETQRSKHSRINVEDVKFSYLVVQRVSSSSPVPESTSWPRIIYPPMKRGGHVIADACTSNGTIDRMIMVKSQGKEIYKSARKVEWGDQWPFDVKTRILDQKWLGKNQRQ